MPSCANLHSWGASPDCEEKQHKSELAYYMPRILSSFSRCARDINWRHLYRPIPPHHVGAFITEFPTPSLGKCELQNWGHCYEMSWNSTSNATSCPQLRQSLMHYKDFTHLCIDVCSRNLHMLAPQAMSPPKRSKIIKCVLVSTAFNQLSWFLTIRIDRLQYLHSTIKVTATRDISNAALISRELISAQLPSHCYHNKAML